MIGTSTAANQPSAQQSASNHANMGANFAEPPTRLAQKSTLDLLESPAKQVPRDVSYGLSQGQKEALAPPDTSGTLAPLCNPLSLDLKITSSTLRYHFDLD